MKIVSFLGFLAVGVFSLAGAAEDISLNGPWRFAYTTSPRQAKVVERFTVAVMVEPNPQIPEADAFAVDMPVPGYWDDHLSYIPEAPWGNDVQYNTVGSQPILFPYPQSGRPRHPDAGTPHVRGVGWYKKTFEAPEDWRGRNILLHVGGARIATYAYVNGIYMDMHLGHGVPFEFDLTDELQYGQKNEIVLAVSNITPYLNSCALRGYAGTSGGIVGDVFLRVSEGPGRIVSYYVHPENQRRQLRWKTELTAPHGLPEVTQLHWAIKNMSGKTIQYGTLPVRSLNPREVVLLDWACDAAGVSEWSTWEPNLHHIEVKWEYQYGKPIDCDSRRFGLRSFEQRDRRLFLNDQPIMLRGFCEIYHFAPSIHPPNDVEFFRRYLNRLKEVGFNYVRFHTWVPMKPYLDAADEVGMLLAPEHSSHRDLQEDTRWADMVRWTRYHPAVVRYCGGNEEVAHEGLIARFAQRYREAKALAPDILITPMHTMSGPESISGRADLPRPAHIDPEKEDAYYNDLWARISRYADIFAARANDFSYSNLSGRDWREVEPEYEHYERPILAHEAGILGTWLDLSLESRYAGSHQGDLYKAAREYVTAAGRLHKTAVYHDHSARWHGQARKYVLENLRKTSVFDGYDLLGALDSHWHNSGYGCGLLNEFLELKPGDTQERILQYNGESVVLIDNAKKFVFRAGESFDVPCMASLYGRDGLRDGVLTWRILDGQSTLLSNTINGLRAPNGAVTTLGNIQFVWPTLDMSKHLVLETELTDATYDITNQWDFWVFTERSAPAVNAAADAGALAMLQSRYPDIRILSQAPNAKLRVVRELTENTLTHLAGGGDVLLLGAAPFPANDTRFVMGVAGRAHMNLATVISDHPAFNYLPHAGWCDWQFKELLEGGKCVEFNKFPVEFDPIVEVVSSYKYIRLQASMWEAQTEGGRLFVTGFNFAMTDPASQSLLDGVLEYVQSDAFNPRVSLSVKEVIKPLLEGFQFKSLKGNDGNFYAGMSPI